MLYTCNLVTTCQALNMLTGISSACQQKLITNMLALTAIVVENSIVALLKTNHQQKDAALLSKMAKPYNICIPPGLAQVFAKV